MSRPKMESLESRCLLAAGGALPAAIPAHVADKIDSRLLHTQDTSTRAIDGIVQIEDARIDAQNRVHVTIRTTGATQALIQNLAQLGARVTTSLNSLGIAEAWVPRGRLDDVARFAEVTSVRVPNYAFNNVTTAGDGLHRANDVRSQFLAYGIDGSGIKIGVISDGADSRAAVGAELPSVTVNPALPGDGDEGTAMLEIVHDLAPGAQLFFSGPLTSVDMVASINWLVGQGCDVIVDDLTFFGESFFSDSEIATAAASAVGSGVVYVTSSGNYSDRQHYQAPYLEGARFGNPASTARYHRFSTGPNDDFNDVSIPSGGILYVFLEWSDAWGTSANNYDLFLTNTSGSNVATSTTVQNGNDLPWEGIGVQNNGPTTFNGQIRIVKRGGAAARELEMFTYGHSTFQHSTPGDALIGQAAVAGVMSIAAAWAGSPNEVEDFSSQGGSTIYTNFATQTKTVRQTLDGTAIDGVETAAGQMGIFFNPFFGTSAAAPHAAAIAALVLQADPTLTPAQVAQIMADTATDLGTPGYDTVSGAGLYNALDAVYKAFTPDAPDLQSSSDTGLIDSDNLTNDPLPTFTATVPLGSYVRLFVDGVQSSTTQLGPSDAIASLAPGAPLSEGPHSITFRIASSSSVALANHSNASSSLEVMIDTQAPTLVSAAFNYDSAFQNITFTLSESIAGSVDPVDLILTGSANGVLPSANLSAGMSTDNFAIFTFPGYAYGALPDDIYDATLLAGSITDLAGNPLAIDLPLSLFYLAGDFNHDGIVNRPDLGIIAVNWHQTGLTMSMGDATYDGRADVFDLYLLAIHWQIGLPLL